MAVARSCCTPSSTTDDSLLACASSTPVRNFPSVCAPLSPAITPHHSHWTLNPLVCTLVYQRIGTTNTVACTTSRPTIIHRSNTWIHRSADSSAPFVRCLCVRALAAFEGAVISSFLYIDNLHTRAQDSAASLSSRLSVVLDTTTHLPPQAAQVALAAMSTDHKSTPYSRSHP